MQRSEQERQGIVDLLLAFMVMVIYFAYMLMIAFAPKLLAKPIAAGSSLSIGLASGILMAIFMVGLCAWYTRRRNRRAEPIS